MKIIDKEFIKEILPILFGVTIGILIGYYILQRPNLIIESKQQIIPEIHYYIEDNKLDSVYVYQDPK